MKALFLVFNSLEAHNGISKKIQYQVDALRKCGVSIQLCYPVINESGEQKRMIDNETLETFGKGVKSKIIKRAQYKNLINYVLQNQIDLLYVRYDHNANPFLINAMKRLKRNGVKIILEIPTYPYDEEYKNTPLKFRLRLMFDKLFRKTLAKQVNKIVTFSDHKYIFNTPAINISNGIDFEHIKIKERKKENSQSLNLIGVAEIHSWHGFDRILNGLVNYYKTDRETTVTITIVGEGDEKVIDNLKMIIKNNNLQKYVCFTGPKFGYELDDLFKEADMGIASLGRHRSNITKIKTLKNREYAARGIPFIYSEMDSDFDSKPYILKAPADESAIDILSIISFYKKCNCDPFEIRNSIKDLSWKIQMQKVIDNILKE